MSKATNEERDMKQWKRFAGTFALASAMTLTAVGTAFAQEQHGHHSHHRQHFASLAKKLELTDAQKEQIRGLRAEHRGEVRSLRKQSHQLRRELRMAIAKDADRATLDALGEKLGRVRVASAKMRYEQRQAFAAILTDEQKAQLQQLRSQRKAKHLQRLQERQLNS